MLKGKKRYLKFNQAINEAIIQSIDKDKKVVVFGEGVQDPSSMWGTLKGINKKFGPKNTVEMPVSENSLIGAAIGASNFGIKSIVCLNRVEFAMYAFEQIFNNAAKSNFLTNGVHRSPIVIRLAIGRGWGQGPTHSQSMESVFSYFPGLKVVMPLMPSDAKDILISSQLTSAMIFNKKIRAANYNIDTYKKTIYIYGIANDEDEKNELIDEAKKILDVQDVIASILLVDDLRVQKN